MKTRYFIITFLLLQIQSCYFKKIQNSADWKKKYEAALQYYEEKKYYKTTLLFEDILPIIRGTKEAEIVQLYTAYSYYYQQQYILSAHHFHTFYNTYGKSEHATDAHFMYAYSLYVQSPEYFLDQSSTFEAISATQDFINKYPYSEYKEKAQEIIDNLQIKLETKAFEIAKQYEKLERYEASIRSFTNFQKDFPDSQYNEEASFLKFKSQYEYSLHSIEEKQKERINISIQYYQEFIDTYSGSKFIKNAEKMYLDCLEKLDTKNK
ncbi:MAG: outer membrane protein assembly factor BamD [Chitinophagaceae bacterium]|nr:outer membrane protein assembly factor BamD [Chitinophagaceae bacterium]